jgi:hypothetical protein
MYPDTRFRDSVAGFFELFFYFAVVSAGYFGLTSGRVPEQFRVAIALFSIVCSLLIVLSVFSILLNGQTVFVGIARSIKVLRIDLDDKPIDDPFFDLKFDVETTFVSYLKRSEKAARTAQRRPNALLFIGTLIALVGLVFFFVTLPGRGGFSLVLQTPTAEGHSDSEGFWSSGLQLVPRLLMLVFIQVLAGFFLRQYRASMEDFRYYESILRHREAQYLSYMLRRKADNKKAIASFALELMEDPQLGMLAKGQTTTTLEAQKLSYHFHNGVNRGLLCM